MPAGESASGVNLWASAASLSIIAAMEKGKVSLNETKMVSYKNDCSYKDKAGTT